MNDNRHTMKPRRAISHLLTEPFPCNCSRHMPLMDMRRSTDRKRLYDYFVVCSTCTTEGPAKGSYEAAVKAWNEKVRPGVIPFPIALTRH